MSSQARINGDLEIAGTHPSCSLGLFVPQILRFLLSLNPTTFLISLLSGLLSITRGLPYLFALLSLPSLSLRASLAAHP